MSPDLARDLHLGIALAFFAAVVLHVVLAFWTLLRARGSGESSFAAVNALFAVTLLLQLAEFGEAAGRLTLAETTMRGLTGAQLAAKVLLVAMLFQLVSTFERPGRGRRSGVRARITRLLARSARFAVPAFYAVTVLGGMLYLSDAAGAADSFARIRGTIGPTSSYLFGAALWFVVFILFPARPGQESLAVPVAGRALLLTTLGLTLGLIALWHDARPRVTNEALLPLLYLHGVPATVFLALVRYELAFMDRFVLGILRTFGAAVVVLAAYWSFNRVLAFASDLGPLWLSVLRVGILLGAVVVAPMAGRALARGGERVLFARRTSAASLQRRFSERLAEGRGLASLIESTCGDIAEALRARGVRVSVGSAGNGREPVELRVPLRVGDEDVGMLLLGARRDLLPYFDGERRQLARIAPLLAGAIAAFRLRQRDARSETRPVSKVADPTDTPPRPIGESKARTHARTERTPVLSDTWRSEVLGAAATIGASDPDAGTRIMGVLDRADAHLAQDGERQITLENEMEFARDLLSLETLRRQNRLVAGAHFPHGLSEQAVPRGVSLRLMERVFDQPHDGHERQLDVRAVQRGDQVELQLTGEGVEPFRAHFPRRDLGRQESA